MSTYQNLLVEDQEGIRIVRFNRPKALNALNETTLKELKEVLANTKGDTSIDVVILTGAGDRAFVAGADISQMSDFSLEQATAFAQLGHDTFAAIESLSQPVIAAVNGFALGGGTELAISCDFIYASTKAKFGQPEVNLGLIPGFGGTQRLMRKIPAGAAREWVMTGKLYPAAEAHRLGLVNEVFPPEELLEATLKTAKLIQQKSHIAVGIAKELMIQGMDFPLKEACAKEVKAFAELFTTDHAKEGTSAFLEKRAPNFSK